jgi:serine/threonine-protein kinase
MIGKSYSQYKVTSKLGEGGMGEVWRAEDTKLGREVALKVLPEAFAQDPDRLARFEREARVLASLSHPNIAGIHGLEEVEGKRFLVMELVEGQTLAELIQQGPMPLNEAVGIAKDIAEAVEAAHEKGVVHRDLKPANVNITPDGKVKVLDFGLAKALAPDPISGESPAQDLSMSPTLTQAMTGLGVLLGTAGYMSPEQARGKPVDRRADIWAFGCILYEMLSGQRLFTGETATDVIGAVVHKDPDLGELSSTVPARIRRLLERCLQKDATRRLQSIGEARITLQEWLEHPEAETVTAGEKTGRPPWLLAAGVAGGLAVGTLLGASFLGGDETPELLRRFEINVSEQGLFSRLGSGIVVSPDGSKIAYTTGSEGQIQSLVLRPLDRFQETVLASGEGSSGPYHPFFSPNGDWVGYVTPGELKKISASGGAPITLAEVERSRGASWGPDGTIVYARSVFTGLSLISAAGGDPRSLTELDEEAGEQSHRWPQWLPGGKAVLFSSLAEGGQFVFEDGAIEVVVVETGERKVLHRGGYYPRYVPTGHILYVHEGTIFALPFDVERLAVTGSQIPVLEGLETNAGQGSAQYAVSDTGLLVYLEGANELEPFPIVWADREGHAETLWAEPGIYGTPRLSPGGERLAVSVLRGANWDVWVYDLDRDVATRITFGEAYDADPVWSPDGRWIAYEGEVDGVDGIFRKRTDGTGDAEVLLEPGEYTFPAPHSWSPDGRHIAIQTSGDGGQTDILILTLDGEGRTGEPEAFAATPFAEHGPSFSPDGRWLAYVSTETGRAEVFVASFPPGGGKWQVSDGGGAQPLWSGDGRELFFRTDEGIMSVRVSTEGESFLATRPEVVFEGNFLGGIRGVLLPGFNFPDYEVAANGDRFVMFQGTTEGALATEAKVVLGWFEELQRLASAGENQ